MVSFIQSDLVVKQNPVQDYRVTELKSWTSVWIRKRLTEIPYGDIISPKGSGTSSLGLLYLLQMDKDLDKKPKLNIFSV